MQDREDQNNQEAIDSIVEDEERLLTIVQGAIARAEGPRRPLRCRRSVKAPQKDAARAPRVPCA